MGQGVNDVIASLSLSLSSLLSLSLSLSSPSLSLSLLSLSSLSPPPPPWPQPPPPLHYAYDSAGRLTEMTLADGPPGIGPMTIRLLPHRLYRRVGPRDPLYPRSRHPPDPLHPPGRRPGRSTSNAETDDAVTTYTYTTAPDPESTTDPPAGLVATETDPLGRDTDYTYDHKGNLIETTYAVGTADEASVYSTYDANGNLVSSTDELARVTQYQDDPPETSSRRLIPILTAPARWPAP